MTSDDKIDVSNIKGFASVFGPTNPWTPPSADQDPELYDINHVYLSTHCLHGRHGDCSSPVGIDAGGSEFARNPAECKVCGHACICACHR